MEETVEKRTFLSEGYASRGYGREELDRRYGDIGISAVAAAMRYQGDAKTDTQSDREARADEAA
jgi:hypothetical protein